MKTTTTHLLTGILAMLKKIFQGTRGKNIAQDSQAIADKNYTEGKTFLDTNKERQGVVTTSSGLQYEILTPGDGPKPETTSTVKVHYQGTFLDGTEFDSSYQQNQPASFAMNRIIAGWKEGLLLMPEGAKYRLFIPSKLAYGRDGAPPVIGGNATLIFDVELLEIVR